MRLLRRKKCERGHTWFPNSEVREFIPTTDTCVVCGARRHSMPYGDCFNLSKSQPHTLASHYQATPEGTLQVIPVGRCPGPA